MKKFFLLLVLMMSMQTFAISNNAQARSEYEWLMTNKIHAMNSVQRAIVDFENARIEFNWLVKHFDNINHYLRLHDTDLKIVYTKLMQANYDLNFASNVIVSNQIRSYIIQHKQVYFVIISRMNQLLVANNNVLYRMSQLSSYGNNILNYIRNVERDVQVIQSRMSRLSEYSRNNPNVLSSSQKKELNVSRNEVVEVQDKLEESKGELAEMKQALKEQESKIETVKDIINQKNDLNRGDFDLDL